MKSNTKSSQGFTLIELLVVVAIISLLSSIVLIGLQSARQKSRNAKRLGDLTQMSSALELYFTQFKGYPSSTGGEPLDLKASSLVTTIPQAPLPADGVCEAQAWPTGSPVPVGTSVNTFYYVASGTPYVLNYNGVNRTLYPDYAYYFCLGHPTGNFSEGVYYISSKGMRKVW